jgi:hypothetical protein
LPERLNRPGMNPLSKHGIFVPEKTSFCACGRLRRKTDFTIAVLSEAYLKSEYTQPEWAAALARDPTGKNRKLVPVRVAKCHLPPMLSEIIYVDLVKLREQDAKRALLDG